MTNPVYMRPASVQPGRGPLPVPEGVIDTPGWGDTEEMLEVWMMIWPADRGRGVLGRRCGLSRSTTATGHDDDDAGG